LLRQNVIGPPQSRTPPSSSRYTRLHVIAWRGIGRPP
jgi:hypothetical protein